MRGVLCAVRLSVYFSFGCKNREIVAAGEGIVVILLLGWDPSSAIK